MTAEPAEVFAITTAIRSIFRDQPNVSVRMGEATGVDKDRKLVQLHDAELRRRIVGALEQAEWESDPQRRQELLTFVLVGAGPTGCELAGELAEHFRRLPAECRTIDPRQARLILAEAGPRALPTFSEPLSNGAIAKLRSIGVDVRTGKAVESVDAEGVIIAGERVRTRTVLWTAGVSASPAGRWLGAETDRPGRVIVRSDLTLPGYPNIFVVGDTAHIEGNGKVLPGVAQVALQSGKHAAREIRARGMHQLPPPPFAYVDKGNMATIATTYAIMERNKVKVGGIPGNRTGRGPNHGDCRTSRPMTGYAKTDLSCRMWLDRDRSPEQTSRGTCSLVAREAAYLRLAGAIMRPDVPRASTDLHQRSPNRREPAGHRRVS
jgi:NADH dehydrogenase FAD-containing subunit